MDHWVWIEKWSLRTDGYGDCGRLRLLKRKMLIDAGWPREALLITVVRDKKGEGHAVLTVKTDKGEFILDNQKRNVVAWTETGYRFVKRQSQSDPMCGSRSVTTVPRSLPQLSRSLTIRNSRTRDPVTSHPPRPRPARARPAIPQWLAALFVGRSNRIDVVSVPAPSC